ncbi:MAG TPA: hypothetical protein ENJ87_02290 [Gammaproteobacteria bacterium]|nr:hypothetical protein [Gammaproteobacteria bacterium]
MIFQCYNKLYEGQVLINGADTLTGYDAARALQNAGFLVYGHAASGDSLYSKSRLWEQVFCGDFDVECLVAASIKIQEENNARGIRPVLLLSQDSAVEYVSKNRDELAQYYTFLIPDPSVIDDLMDKTLFHSWAIANDILVPESRIANDSAGLESAFKNLDYPAIIKPLVRTDKWDNRFPNDKLIFVENETDINKVPSDIFSLSDSYIVQEWVPGGDEDVYFVLLHIDEKSECISMAGRKLLQWPVLSGSTATCVSIEDDELSSLGEDVMLRSGLKGLGSIEFKKHSETNRYYAIEPTVGRNDYQSYISTASNINLSLYYVLNCMRYSYVANAACSSSMWIDEINSLRSLFASRSGRPSSNESYSPFKRRIKFANLTLTDLATFARLILGFVESKIKNIFKKLQYIIKSEKC